jgi:hypothetical protein
MIHTSGIDENDFHIRGGNFAGNDGVSRQSSWARRPDLDAAILGRELGVPEDFDLLCAFEGLEETVAWVQSDLERGRARRCPVLGPRPWRGPCCTWLWG